MATSKYYIRFSNSDDLDKIMEFYDLNAHKNVRKRQAELIEKLATDGAVIMIEDAAGKIVATSITYPHNIADSDGVERTKWQELGSTRCILNGYPGLFDVMVTMQALRAFLVEPPEDRFVAQMHTAPVQKMAEKLGWRRFEPEDALIDAKFKTIDASDVSAASRGNWFQCGMESLPVMAQRMREAMDKPCLEHVKNGNKIELDFSKSQFFSIFEKDIRALADNKSLGDPDHPDMKKSVAKHQQAWMRRHFK